MSNRNEDWRNSNFKTTFSNKQNEQEDITSLRASREKENNYNLNVATFTFGGRQSNLLSENLTDTMNNNLFKKASLNRNINSISKEKDDDNQLEKTDQEKSHLIRNSQNQMKFNSPTMTVQNNTFSVNTPTEMSHLSNNNIITTIPLELNLGPVILNRIGDHNSFLSVVIYALWNMKFMRKYIINDLNTLNEKDAKNNLFYNLKSLFLKYERNKILDVIKVRISLAETFQNRRKFLLDQPDDPVDCYFAFINSIHSHHIQTSLGEIKDTNCYNKCLAHKYLWIDLCRVDECECKGTSKRLFSYHNYIFDIPLDKIFDLTTNTNLIEMSKSFKLKSLNNKNSINNNNNPFSFGIDLNSISTGNNLLDSKGKLFIYFKILFNQLKTDCPEKGHSCELNKTHRAFFLANIPFNLNFSLVSPKKYNKNLTFMEILKTIILIPKILDLSVMFDYSSKQKVFYDFFGCFLIKPSKTFSCCFRQNNKDESYSWVYYDCGKIVSQSNTNLQNTIISFSNWSDLVSFLLANGEYPIMLFYQIQQKYQVDDKEITNEEILTLERYAKSADNFNNIVINKFRTSEDIIRSEQSSSSNSINFNSGNDQKNINLNPNQNKTSINLNNKNRDKSPLNTNNNSRLDINSNSNNSNITGEYKCIFCFANNRIEDIFCLKCNHNNEAVIEDLIKKRHANNNYINIANFNLNINTDEKMSFKTKDNNNNINRNSNIINNNNNKNIQDRNNTSGLCKNNTIEREKYYDNYNKGNLNNDSIKNQNQKINEARYENNERDRDRDSRPSNYNKKYSEAIQPQVKKNPFTNESNKKEKEKNTINYEEEITNRNKNHNMPKQISHKIINNNSSLKQNQNQNQNQNPEKNKERDLLLYPEKLRRDLSEGNSTNYHNNNSNNISSHNQTVNVVKSSSKKNIDMNQSPNNNNPLMIQHDNNDNKNKKFEIVQGGSYISTPVFNVNKENKSNEKDRSKISEDRVKPFKEEKDKLKINNNNNKQDKNQTQNQNNSKNQNIINNVNNLNEKYIGITNPKNPHDHWICENCSSVNKTSNLKCIECKRNYSIRESFNRNDNISRASDAQSRQSKEKDNDSFNSFNHQETFGNRNRSTDPSYVNQVQINLDKDNNKKNINDRRNNNIINNNQINSITSPPSEKKLINNYFSEKNESSKSKGCICQTHPEEALLKNGICRLCDRNVKIASNNYNTYQNQIYNIDNINTIPKKPNTADYNSNSQINNNNKKNNLLKKPNEKERPIMINENNKKRTEFDKLKSPSSNNIKGKSIINNNNNRIEDDRINLKQNIHPFNKQPSKGESKDKEISKQVRMNSTNKKPKIEPYKNKK